MNDSESVQNAEDAVEEKLQRSWLEDCWSVLINSWKSQ
jgi:hypothetical protein